MAEGASHDSDRSALARLGQIAAVIGGVAAVVYALGLVALWAPIARAYKGGASTAWYAVSLVPQTNVAGQGLAQILVGPVAFGVVTLLTLTLVLLVGNLLVSSERGQSGESGETETPTLIALATTIGSIAVGISLLSEVANLLNLFNSYFSGTSWFTYIVGLAALLIPSLVGVPVGIMLARHKAPTDRLITRLDPRDNYTRTLLLIGLGIALAGAFVVAWLRSPPLPKAEVVWDKATWGEKKTTGELLAQSGGYWYIFDKTNQTLTAIPSGDVDTIYFSD